MKTQISNIIAEIKNELKSHHTRLDFYYDKAIRAAENGNFSLLLASIKKAEKAITADPLLQKLDHLYKIKMANH